MTFPFPGIMSALEAAIFQRRERIGRAQLLEGGYDGWLRVELALHLKETYPQVYRNVRPCATGIYANDAIMVELLLQPHDTSVGLQAMHIRCVSYWNKDKFAAQFVDDIVTKGLVTPKEQHCQGSGVTVYCVGITPRSSDVHHVRMLLSSYGIPGEEIHEMNTAAWAGINTAPHTLKTPFSVIWWTRQYQHEHMQQ
jgi:hypothetical protein